MHQGTASLRWQSEARTRDEGAGWHEIRTLPYALRIAGGGHVARKGLWETIAQLGSVVGSRACMERGTADAD